MDVSKFEGIVSRLSGASVVAGWPDGNLTAAEAYAHLLDERATGKNQPALGRPVSLALIARTLNYRREPGTTLGGVKYGAIPARPFMDLARKNFESEFPRLLKAYLPKVLSGTMSVDSFLSMVGARMEGKIREAMTDGNWTPLAPSTLARRRHGGNAPLVDTGTLRASVSHEVKKRG